MAHAKMAEDSCRMTFVMTKQMRQDLLQIATARLVKVSDVVRELMFVGIEREKKKWQANRESV